MDTEEEWVVLRDLLDRVEASLLAEFLDNQQIPVTLEGVYSAGLLPGVESVRVMVPSGRLGEARLAAEAFDGKTFDPP
ncbi:MAG: hypothetical protein FWD73_16975 [Polyangiaceae bacterium]|nr:hypothetical protein [Polyangiaceae bacterium]